LIVRLIASRGADDDSGPSGWLAWRTKRSGRPRRFPPEQVAAVKAVACERPIVHERPLSRFSRAELYRLVLERA
jgi:hypothetical protein